MIKAIVGNIILFWFIAMGVAYALPPERSVEEIMHTKAGATTAVRSIETGKTKPALYSVLHSLSDSYGVTFSWEWAYVDMEGQRVPQPCISFQITEGESLQSALDRFIQAAEGLLELVTTKRHLCVVTTGNRWQEECNLDVPISLQLDSVSLWDALQALRTEVNQNAINGRWFWVSVRCDPPGQRQGAEEPRGSLPKAVFAERTLSVNLENVTARTALCAIINKSPYQAEYSYANNYNRRRAPYTFSSSARVYLLDVPSDVRRLSFEKERSFYGQQTGVPLKEIEQAACSRETWKLSEERLKITGPIKIQGDISDAPASLFWDVYYDYMGEGALAWDAVDWARKAVPHVEVVHECNVPGEFEDK